MKGTIRVIKKFIYGIRKKVYHFFNMGIDFNYRKFIRGGGKIGKGCEIFPNVEFGSEPYLIRIGNNVRITNGVKFVTHDGGVWTLRKMGLLKNADVFGTIEIGDNVHLGWNVILMPNVKIGKNCIIGAGAVVTKSIPDNSVAAGVPAKVIETIENYAEKIKVNCDYTKQFSWQEKKQYLEKKYAFFLNGF